MSDSYGLVLTLRIEQFICRSESGSELAENWGCPRPQPKTVTVRDLYNS